MIFQGQTYGFLLELKPPRRGLANVIRCKMHKWP